jgi:hypothetical protein
VVTNACILAIPDNRYTTPAIEHIVCGSFITTATQRPRTHICYLHAHTTLEARRPDLHSFVSHSLLRETRSSMQSLRRTPATYARVLTAYTRTHELTHATQTNGHCQNVTTSTLCTCTRPELWTNTRTPRTHRGVVYS